MKSFLTEVIDDLVAGNQREPQVHHFQSNGEAYDRSQTDDEIKDGDILVTPRAIAILLQAWPTLVVGDPNEYNRSVLHQLKDGPDQWNYIEGGKYANAYRKAHTIPEYSRLKNVQPSETRSRESHEWEEQGEQSLGGPLGKRASTYNEITALTKELGGVVADGINWTWSLFPTVEVARAFHDRLGSDVETRGVSDQLGPGHINRAPTMTAGVRWR